MFGKLEVDLRCELPPAEIDQRINDWAQRNNLNRLHSTSEQLSRFRYGTPLISNPIYIEVRHSDQLISISG